MNRVKSFNSLFSSVHCSSGCIVDTEYKKGYEQASAKLYFFPFLFSDSVNMWCKEFLRRYSDLIFVFESPLRIFLHE